MIGRETCFTVFPLEIVWLHNPEFQTDIARV